MPHSPKGLRKPANSNFGFECAAPPREGDQAETDCSADLIGPTMHCSDCTLRSGQVVSVRFGREHARFLVTWVGKPGTPHEGHVGLQKVHAARHTWDVTLTREAKGSSKGDAHPQLQLALSPDRGRAGRN